MGSDRGWAWTLVPFAIIVWVVSVISLIRGGEVMGSDRLTEIAERLQHGAVWSPLSRNPKDAEDIGFLLGEIQRLTLAHAEAERELSELRDLPLCRLQLPSGGVPGNTREALEAWHREANRFWDERDALKAQLAEAERVLDKAVVDAVAQWTEHWSEERAFRLQAEQERDEARTALATLYQQITALAHGDHEAAYDLRNELRALGQAEGGQQS